MVWLARTASAPRVRPAISRKARSAASAQAKTERASSRNRRPASVSSILRPTRSMPFNLGWWGFTFPLAVYTLATLALANATHLAFLSVIGAVLVLCLAGFWLIVAARTAHGAWRRTLFVAPCLAAADHPFGLRNR